MSDFKDWYVEPPPRDAIVLYKYSLDDEWQRCKTCKRGCCMDAGMGSQVLPNFWKETEDQTPIEHMPIFPLKDFYQK